jgi:hypothetical protein
VSLKGGRDYSGVVQTKAKVKTNKIMIFYLSPDAVATLMGYPAQLFSNIWVLIALTAGVLAGFYIIEEAVGLFNFGDSEEEENKYYEDDDGNVYGKLPQFVVDAWKRDGKL